MTKKTSPKTAKKPTKAASSVHEKKVRAVSHKPLKNRFLINRQWQKRVLIVLVAVVVGWTGVMYATAQWYIAKHKEEPLRIGATFIPNYSRYFGLDPKENMDAMINELGVRQFRLVSYWKEIEKTEGQYDFTELDWQFEKVAAAGGKVSLAIGLRQPRWPECHPPDWINARADNIDVWYPKLRTFMSKVIERYGNNPTLESYQLENEFFMTVFGICPDHSRWRLVEEYDLVKSLDKDTPVTISRSNNWIGLPLGDPRPDEFAISVYKRVWDKSVTKRYFEYPLPAWFYASLAGGAEIFTGNDMVIHELQAESWLPEGMNMQTASTEELSKSLNAERLKDRIKYGVATGMRDIYLWGPEWWYFMKTKRGEPALWDTAVVELAKYR
ncbi:MAG: beta-galactosidase [bacterium]|nr:beta-galactosidase [bacterium]